MKKTTSLKCAIALGGATLFAVAAPLAANAHVTVTPSSTAATSYSVLSFAVGHGCEGSPTTALTFTVPDAIESITPTVNPGWAIAKNGNQVVYTAESPLPDGQRTTFELSVKLPELPAGEQLAFPVLQSCEVGSIDWAEAATEGGTEPDYPAPVIVLTESTGDGHGHDAPVSEDAEQEHSAAETPGSDDVLARVLGLTGLVVGTVGIVLAVTTRRKAVK